MPHPGTSSAPRAPGRARARGRARRRRAGAAVALGALLAVTATSPTAGATTPAGSSVPPGVVEVDGAAVPVLGTFARRAGGEGDERLVRGAVHGVQRVDGATLLYASVGVAADAPGRFTAAAFFRGTGGAYPIDVLQQLHLVDRAGLKVYRVLVDDATRYTTARPDARADQGEVRVLWAAFPELPATVDTVDVVLGDTNAVVARVPVADGALVPTSDEPAPRPGEGWPPAPGAEVLVAADPAASTFDLFRRTTSADRVVAIAESAQEVDTTLDANVLFDTSSATLTPAARDVLAGVAADVAARGSGVVVVTGHTDSDGSSGSNQTLSEQRAAAVVEALRPAAGAAVSFEALGSGERDPVAPNDSPENKQLNRRVTVRYTIGGDA